MKITSYNQNEAIDYLKALAHLYWMTEGTFVPNSEHKHGMKLWDLAAAMTTEDAKRAVKAFEATQ